MGQSVSMNMSHPAVVPAAARHTATLIFMHGLGDTGHSWASVLSEIKLSHLKIVCPHAPEMPVTLNAGFRMPSWFDLRTLDPSGPEDEEGIKRARDTIRGLIEQEERNGIQSNRVVLGGFSQGGALAFYTGLTTPKKLAGLVCLSGWIPLHKSFPGALVNEQKETPIFQAHGESDVVVPFPWGRMSKKHLEDVIPNWTFKSYANMGHSSCDSEMRDLKAFLEKVLPPI
jgi:lysophospholipase-2